MKRSLLTGLTALLVVVFLLGGCLTRDATRGLDAPELLRRTASAAESIENAELSGGLTAGTVELNYEGTAVFRGPAAGEKLLTLTMRNEEGETAGVQIYMTPDALFVRPPDEDWTSSRLDPALEEGWSSIVEQTRVADPAQALSRILEAAREVSFVSNEEENGTEFKVLRVEAELEKALELFGGVLPPELPLEAYAGFHHTIWVAKDTLLPHRFSIHVQILTSTGDLLPVHMEFSYRNINRAELVLPEALQNVLEGGG